jgi:hypothetical protein
MIQNRIQIPVSGIIILLLVLANIIAITEGYVNNEKWYGVLLLTLPLLVLAIINIRRQKHTGAPKWQAEPDAPGVEDEGSISEYNLNGGELIWQIGADYFGCRDNKGRFHPMAFRKNALRPQVKMIELEISQGTKPVRHTEFDNPVGMVMFLELLRELSGGKPVGFKIYIGDRQEFIDICNAIKATGCMPDFITVEGGAAPLSFVKQTLDDFDLARYIKIIGAPPVEGWRFLYEDGFSNAV